MSSNRFRGSSVLTAFGLTFWRGVWPPSPNPAPEDVSLQAPTSDPAAPDTSRPPASLKNSRRRRYHRSSVISDDRMSEAFRISMTLPCSSHSATPRTLAPGRPERPAHDLSVDGREPGNPREARFVTYRMGGWQTGRGRPRRRTCYFRRALTKSGTPY